MMRYTIRVILALITALSTLGLYAQEPDLVIYGTVRDLASGDSIPNARVVLREAGKEVGIVTVLTNARGRYELVLNEANVYTISYSAPGKMVKSVQVDSRGPTPAQWEGGYGMNVDIRLAESVEGLDPSVFEAPWGRAAFDTTTANFAWDLEYTKERARIMKAATEGNTLPSGR